MKLSYRSILLLPLILGGCANTTIYPTEGNTFTSVSTSSDLGYAENDAKNKAESHCKKLGQRLRVLNHKKEYNGPDSHAIVAGAIMGSLTGGSNLAVSNSDYEVTLHFKCVS